VPVFVGVDEMFEIPSNDEVELYDDDNVLPDAILASVVDLRTDFNVLISLKNFDILLVTTSYMQSRSYVPGTGTGRPLPGIGTSFRLRITRREPFGTSVE
jgi:hypothetical protein